MRIGEHGAINCCPVCGKEFWVQVPEMWAYVIAHRKCCSWGCLRKAEKTGLRRLIQSQEIKQANYTPPEHWYRMRELRDQGMSHKEIALEFGIRETSVGSIISKLAKYEKTKERGA